MRTPGSPSPASTLSPSEEGSGEPQCLHRDPQEPQQVNQHQTDVLDNWIESQAGTCPQELSPRF